MARTKRTPHALIERYIEQNPHWSGLDEARLIGYGVAVWALIGYLSGAMEMFSASRKIMTFPSSS
jgi:hypothetical protein